MAYILTLFFLLFTKICLLSQVIDKDIYLSNNRFTLDSNETNTDFKDARIYAIGEIHNYRKSFDLQLEVLESLINEKGVNVLLMEASSSTYFLYQKLKENSNKYVYIKGRKAKIFPHRKVRKYYSSLGKMQSKYNFVCEPLDIEFRFSQSLSVLWMILNENIKYIGNGRTEIMNLIFENNIFRNNKELYSISRNVIDNFYRDSSLYQKELIKYYGDYFRIIAGLEAGIIFELKSHDFKDYSMRRNAYKESYLYRELYIYNKIQKALFTYPDRKLFGAFGITHVIDYKENWLGIEDWVSAFERLNRDYPNQICRFICYYEKKKLADDELISKTDLQIFIKNAISNWTFFNMNDNNPFNIKFDYLIFIKKD